MSTVEEQLRRYSERLETMVPQRHAAPIPSVVPPRRPRPALRPAGVFAAVAVVATGALVWTASKDDKAADTVVIAPPSTADVTPTTSLAPTTTTPVTSTTGVAPATESDPGERDTFSQVWTGRELIVFGGQTFSLGSGTLTFVDGWAYDVETGAWRPIAPGLSPRSHHSAVWLDGRMYVVGGTRTEVDAYDPLTDSWRRLPDAPIELSQGLGDGLLRAVAIAVGDRLAVWSPGNGVGALYDPATDVWTLLPGSTDRRARIVRMFSVDGTLVVMSAENYEGTLRGLLIDLEGWRADEMPPLRFEARVDGQTWRSTPMVESTGVSGRGIVAWGRAGREMEARRFDLDRREWTFVPAPGLEPCEGYPPSLDVGGRLVIGDCGGRMLLFDPESGETTPIDGAVWADSVWTGDELLAWVVPVPGSGEPFLWRQPLGFG